MNELAQNQSADARLQSSCRVPLLALFGGAAFWLVISSVLALIASLNFHMPEKFANCAWLTYGRIAPAANDALLYGFCVPAGLGVLLWIFTQLGKTPLRDPLVPIIAANLWHLGVLIGLCEILSGNSTGFDWLEFQRGSSVLLFIAYLLLALWAMMNFAGRREQMVQPPHWFFIAALFWFPWIYSTANLLLVAWPVRGVAQAVIAWWFSNNLIFIWLALVGLGTVFYFLPKFAGRPLQNRHYALFAFWTLLWFGASRGVSIGAPVPAWLSALSAVNSLLLIMPILVIAIIFWRTIRKPAGAPCKGGPFCMIKFGTVAFLLSALMLFATACPHFSELTQFTWFNTAQTQLQIYGFFAITMFGAIYYILPRAVNLEFPFPKFIRVQHWFSMGGIIILVAALAVGGIVHGFQLQNPKESSIEMVKATLPFLRVSTLGLLFILIGNFLFALNVFTMTFKWKFGLLKTGFGMVIAPLKTSQRDQMEVRP